MHKFVLYLIYLFYSIANLFPLFSKLLITEQFCLEPPSGEYLAHNGSGFEILLINTTLTYTCEPGYASLNYILTCSGSPNEEPNWIGDTPKCQSKKKLMVGLHILKNEKAKLCNKII